MSQTTISIELQKDIDVLNASLEGEYFGIAAYKAAIESGLLHDGVRSVAEKFQNDHKEHAQRIREAILAREGMPIKPRPWEEYAQESPPPALRDQTDVLRYAANLEQSAASGSVESVSKFSSPELARLAASIAGVEAMHWSVLLGALGDDPVPVSFIPSPES